MNNIFPLGNMLDFKRIGDNLTKIEQKTLFNTIVSLYNYAKSKRRYQREVLRHHQLQNILLNFFDVKGYDTKSEVYFKIGEDKVFFDVVAKRGKNFIIMEVKDRLTDRDIGQLSGYTHMLRVTKTKAKLFLCTDILNFDHARVGKFVKLLNKIMEDEHVGIIFADKSFIMICQNINQLFLSEMPEFWFAGESMI